MPLLDLESEPLKMHHSPLLPPCLKTKSWYPCHRVKLSLISISHCLDQDTATPPKLPSSAFDFVHAQIPLSLFTSHAQKLAEEKLTDSPSSFIFSKMLSFDFCTLKRKKNTCKAGLNPNGIDFCLNCFAFK